MDLHFHWIRTRSWHPVTLHAYADVIMIRRHSARRANAWTDWCALLDELFSGVQQRRADAQLNTSGYHVVYAPDCHYNQCSMDRSQQT